MRPGWPSPAQPSSGALAALRAGLNRTPARRASRRSRRPPSDGETWKGSSIPMCAQLRFERGYGLLDHDPMGRRGRSSEIGAHPCERQFERAPPVICFRRRPRSRQSFRLGLLILDVLALEPASHTVFYRDGTLRPPTRILDRAASPPPNSESRREPGDPGRRRLSGDAIRPAGRPIRSCARRSPIVWAG